MKRPLFGSCYLKALVLVRCNAKERGKLRQEGCQSPKATTYASKLKVTLDYVARSCLKRKIYRAGEMVHGLRVLAVLPEDLNSVCSNHVQFPTFTSGSFTNLYSSLGGCVCVHTLMAFEGTHTHNTGIDMHI